MGELSRAQALALLSLPASLGAHPSSGAAVHLNVGRFGAYLTMEAVPSKNADAVSVSINAKRNPFEIEIDEAIR